MKRHKDYVVDNVLPKKKKNSSKVPSRESDDLLNDNQEDSQVLPNTLSITEVMCTRSNDDKNSDKNNKNEQNANKDDSGEKTDDDISDGGDKNDFLELSDSESGEGHSGKTEVEINIVDANDKFIFYSKVKGPTMKHFKKWFLL